MSEFLDTLLSVLLKDKRLLSQDGGLLRNMAYELGFKMDPELLQLLHKNRSTRKHFFTKVGDLAVFDKMKFCWVVNNREFLPDSYTRFSNRVGLVDDLEKPISQTENVQLVWPFKDCILEGGQTKDDQKRTEVFWNELLAPDECDRLLYPKVMANPRRYTQEGSKKTATFDHAEDNLLIKGNNLLALASLLPVYEGKVKLIYIDPPYNTGSDSFQYNDRFNHAAWLTFMKNRLEIAIKLLQENGLIFIHIGDGEMHYLKIVADGIFGRESFVATIPRKTRSGKSDVPYKLSQDFDWMLVYTNAKSTKSKLFQRSVERKYYKSQDYPEDEWRLTDLTTQRSTAERPNSDFTLINPRDGKKYPVNPDRCWSITYETQEDFLKKGKIVFPGDYNFLRIETPYMRVFKSEEIEKNGEGFDQGYVSTDFLNKAMDILLQSVPNKKGTDEIVELFGEKAFAYPKNELLLSTIIEYCTSPGDIVLDFFSGSGTTLAVAHKMGRRFIGVEQMDYIETVTVERLKQVIGTKKKAKDKLIEEIDYDRGGVSKSVSWGGGGSFVYCELAALNTGYIVRINNIKQGDDAGLAALWEEIKGSGFISYKVDLEAVDEEGDGFESLSFADKKRFLIEVLDKNLLYVNLCDLDDEEFGLDKTSKEFSQSFYGGRK